MLVQLPVVINYETEVQLVMDRYIHPDVTAVSPIQRG